MIDGGTSFEVKIEWKTRITNQGGRARGLRSWFAKSTASGFNSHFLQQNGRRSSLLFGCEAVSNQNTQQALALPEKEVIQPHLPVRLPCYDFTTVTSPAFGIPLLAVKVTTSGMASSYSVTGGELQPAIRTKDGFLELAHPRGTATLCPVHCGILNALATALHGSIRTAPSIHRLRLGLLGYLISFAPLAFVSQCQCRPSRVLSPLVFFPISTHFTAPPEIPSAPTVLQLDNAYILCITAAAGIELADAYSPDSVIASSPGKEVHDPWAFYLHAALLHQAFAHCGKFPTAASRRSLGRVSVPVWLIILLDQLLIITLALTHPPWTNLTEEPLGFRGIGFSPMFALLKPTFSLPLRLLPLTRVLPPKAERSPTNSIFSSHRFSRSLSPVHLRRKSA
ncbi:hypothetical protein V6N12_058334 [Hibiscus sabdariffa]|uniref:Uncharacterized protein n=1 Tax=Hibiscus sabdariffa TaxID=183260 RepID=A0ABR2EVX2_9ROSI